MSMPVRSGGRKLSFEILSGSNSWEEDELLLVRSSSDPSEERNGDLKTSRRRRKKKGNKTKKNTIVDSIVEDPIAELDTGSGGGGSTSSAVFAESKNMVSGNGFHQEIGFASNFDKSCIQSVVFEEVVVVPEDPIKKPGKEPACWRFWGGNGRLVGELRQRSVSDGGSCEELLSMQVEESRKEEDRSSLSSSEKLRIEANGNAVGRLETEESLDWKRAMAEDPTDTFSIAKSPVRYFMDEMHNGNSLRSTTTLGNEKERESVYDTIFRLPWRCELLINVGLFVCFDSFLSLLTIMPTRILMTVWRLSRTRQFKKPSAAELSDFGCLIVLACGVLLLQQTDISLIYHMIRGQGTIKLYVVYNVLEIFDKLCQSFGGDVLRTLFNSAEGLAGCSPENTGFWLWRFFFDQTLAVASSIAHSFVLLAQAITLSTCIVAHNNALLALLVSNNFAEIKSNVFKRFSKDNIHSMVYYDSVERFHISAFLLFVLAQNILEAEGPWFESFLYNASLVYVCELVVDIIKHSFIAKFNEIKPIAYSEFLEDLSKQTLNIEIKDVKKNLTFVPIAPACVVIRVLTPVYAARLPLSPLPWRVFWIFLLSAVTYVMLASLKVMIGMGLRKHATWYINRCRKRKHHLHND